ncbi:IL6RA protein, partial [Urocolius indicus]|nr:IL6RA protein [Urocolius indicus]
PPGLSQDTLLGRPGANITLSCWTQGPPNVTVSWRLEQRGQAGPGTGTRTGRSHKRQLPEGNELFLQHLSPEDSGHYGCYSGSQRLRSLRLLVEEPPETPRVSCLRRSHDRDVVCEWPQRAKPSPGTRAMLWL